MNGEGVLASRHHLDGAVCFERYNDRFVVDCAVEVVVVVVDLSAVRGHVLEIARVLVEQQNTLGSGWIDYRVDYAETV